MDSQGLAAALAGGGKPVILIGGANGTGKSRLARRLMASGTIDHMIGTGFLREIVRSTTTPEQDPLLFEYSFGGADPFATLLAQAERLRPAVLSCVARAVREGTSLVMEGTHLLPDLYADVEVSAFVVLAAPSEPADHDKWLLGDSHTLRVIGEDGRRAVRHINRVLLERAESLQVAIVRNPDDFDTIVPMTQYAGGERRSSS